ncbi:MAG: hypothetical protein HKN87_07255 [Saprospiraceae bacterium]|nr:hypothetical protein [Saprospiraceae bacterium]
MCQYSKSRVFYNTFTPNGDLRNGWTTVFGGPLLASIKQLNIYNRWVTWYSENLILPPTMFRSVGMELDK